MKINWAVVLAWFLLVPGTGVLFYGSLYYVAKTAVRVVQAYEAPRPTWNGKNWSCPVGYDVYASEEEAMKGDPNFVHCVGSQP